MKLETIIALSLVISFSAQALDSAEYFLYRDAQRRITKEGIEALKLPPGEVRLSFEEVDGGSLTGKAYYYSSFRLVLTDVSSRVDEVTGVVLHEGKRKILSDKVSYSPGVDIADYGTYSISGSTVAAVSAAHDGERHSIQNIAGVLLRDYPPGHAGISFGILVCLHRRTYWRMSSITVVCKEVPVSHLKDAKTVAISLENPKTKERGKAILEIR